MSGTSKAYRGGPFVTMTADGEITSRHGRVFLNAGKALKVSLGDPVAGADYQGEDNAELEIVDVSGHAHVLTTNEGVLTFSGTKNALCRVVGFGGAWHLLNGTWD